MKLYGQNFRIRDENTVKAYIADYIVLITIVIYCVRSANEH